MRKLLQSIFLMLFISTAALAQERTITGIVSGVENGTPIHGATVSASGTTGGTSTDANGKYSIRIPSNVKSILISSVGYLPKLAVLGASNVLNVALESDSKSLSDVVVVAYGTAKKEAITGSVATLSSADIDKRVVTNVTNILAGLAPGISVAATNGQPGTSSSIRLRGFGSFSAGNSPLFVVDGAQYDGNIGDINPDDIESVSILKDATSSALYGARAANGVIIITTKRGKSATPQVSASFSRGFNTRGIPEYDRVNAFEYYPAMWQGLKNNYQFSASPVLTEAAAAQKATDNIQSLLVYNPFNVPNNQIVGINGKINPAASLKYNDFDWYAPLQRVGNRTDAGVSASGKSDKSDYYISMGYLKDNGYVLKSDFERFNARINVNTKIRPWLKTGLNISGSLSNSNLASDNATGNGASFINIFQFARGIGPIYPVHAFDATGQPIMNPATGEQWYDYGSYPGAVARPQGASPGRNVVLETMLNSTLNKRSMVSARSYFDFKFLKDFTFTPSFNVDIRNSNGMTFQNPTVGDGNSQNGYLSNSGNNTQSYTFTQLLNYTKQFNLHNISVIAVHETYDYSYRTFSTSKTGIILTGNTELDNFVTPFGSSGHKDRETLESYFSKATYNYDQKYFVEGSVRRDGSSRFSPQSRWGTFYSVGGSWSISKESFLEHVSWLDDLRVKASYGQVGNNQISSYYGYQAFYDLGWNNGAEPGVLLSSAATPDLKWEKSNTFNSGIDFSLFRKRVYGTLEVFKRGSDQLIFSVPQPLSDPVTSINANIGSMYNKGIELQLGGDIVRARDFTWSLLTNWTMFKNEITKMPAQTPIITSGTKRREVGGDYYRFWLRQYAGVDPTDGSSLYIPADGTAAANIRSVKGKDYVTSQTYAKFDYSGTSIPDLMGSFTNTFRYKNFSLSMLVNYQIGGKFYDAVYQGLMSVGSYGGSLHKDILGSWTTTNTTSNIPRIDVGNTANINATSSRWLVDASYINFSNINLAYRFPTELLRKYNLKNMTFYIAGENLSLISKRTGMNPVESYDGLNANTYTPSRVISVGANITF